MIAGRLFAWSARFPCGRSTDRALHDAIRRAVQARLVPHPALSNSSSYAVLLGAIGLKILTS
jgi:hypothetical protein